MIIAIDPGREKCGVAALETSGELLWCEIWLRGEFLSRLQTRLQVLAPTAFVLGDSTASGEIAAIVREVCPDITLHIVDEKNSTLQARDLFWQLNPPRGWRRLVPLSLQNPPRPIDDYAAVVLARRWLQTQNFAD